MGAVWDKIISWFTFTEPEITGPQFVIDSTAIPAEVLGLTTYDDPINPVARISRQQAIQVPAVKNGRDLIAGTIGTIPFKMLDTDNVEVISSLLSQPERNVARSLTFTRTVEDLLFEAWSWWKVTERDWRNYPTKVERLPVRSVFYDSVKKQWYVDRPGPTKTLPNGIAQYSVDSASREYLRDADLIRFDSPTDPILVAGARAIRTYLKLAAAADRYADSPMPQGYFTPRPEADPDDTDVEEFLDDWATARRTRADAYVPGVVEYRSMQWDPAQLQLNEARQAAVVEIARLFNLDAEDLNVSTTSRTYANIQDRRLTKINDALGMYIAAICERLSMGDVTPRTNRVVADFNGFLRADDKSRLETYAIGLSLGIYDRNAIAERESLPQPRFPAPEQRAIEAPVGDSNG